MKEHSDSAGACSQINKCSGRTKASLKETLMKKFFWTDGAIVASRVAILPRARELHVPRESVRSLEGTESVAKGVAR